jgi:plastocyanin
MTREGQPLRISADEYRFNPKNIVVSTAGKPSAKVRVELKNDGAQAHDIRFLRAGEDAGGTPVFGPGQTKSVELTLVKGDYDIICTVGDHEQLGMKGRVTVK